MLAVDQSEQGQVRLFLAIPLPDDLRDRLEEIKHYLDKRMQKVAGFRWMDPSTWHITILFIGEVPREEVPWLIKKVKDVASQVDPFKVVPAGLGWAPPDIRGRTGVVRYRMLWVYFKEEASLETLAFGLFHALKRRAPNIARPRKPINPHVTLARFKWTKVTELPQLVPLEYSKPIYVDRFELWESRLKAALPSKRFINLYTFQLASSTEEKDA